MQRMHAVVAGGALCVWLGAAGPSRAADTPPGNDAALPDRDKVCTTCHDQDWRKPVLAIYQTRMGQMTGLTTSLCQTCHGPSDAHLSDVSSPPDVVFDVKSKARSSGQVINAACLGCHGKDTRRLLWPGSMHEGRGLACTNCHEIHAPNQRVLSKATQAEVCFTCHKTIRAQTQRISTHPIAAGKVACSDCHNPHGSAAPRLLARTTVNETCYQCHAEKRGPFLWEHPPVVDDCTNCHTPHGSTNAPLLKARAPWLCQQCHGDGAPHPGQVYSAANLPGGIASNNNASGAAGAAVINPVTGVRVTANNPEPRLAFRACANCHSQIHGSNHPGGNRFLR